MRRPIDLDRRALLPLSRLRTDRHNYVLMPVTCDHVGGRVTVTLLNLRVDAHGRPLSAAIGVSGQVAVRP